uniref:Uncharacterized protein n=1 Tax=viral metagenome TaxID=1070528 RepID=A0A6C0LSI9_9ZZZZ
MKDWMMPLTILCIGGAILGIGAIVGTSVVSKNPFEAKNLFDRDMEKPILWVFYDTSIPNARKYNDFGSRSSRALNLPFLNLCYESIVKHNKSQYRIEVVDGLTGLADKLGGWDKLPAKYQNPLVTLEPADLCWIRAALLSKYGGLWVAPATICLAPFGHLPQKPVFFGTDPDESFAGTAGTAVPNFQVAWAPSPNNPLWAGWEAKSRQRLSASGGGDTARNDHKWEFLAVTALYPDIEVRPNVEVSRKGAAGRRIQIEDILAAGQDGDWPFEVYPTSQYVPLPWPELRDRRVFGWFLRMSEDQIKESDLVIRDLFNLAGV